MSCGPCQFVPKCERREGALCGACGPAASKNKNDCDTAAAVHFLRVIGAVVMGHRGCCDGSPRCFLELRSFPTSQPRGNKHSPPQKKETHFRNGEWIGSTGRPKKVSAEWHATCHSYSALNFHMISHQATQNTKEPTEREEIAC